MDYVLILDGLYSLVRLNLTGESYGGESLALN